MNYSKIRDEIIARRSEKPSSDGIEYQATNSKIINVSRSEYFVLSHLDSRLNLKGKVTFDTLRKQYKTLRSYDIPRAYNAESQRALRNMKPLNEQDTKQFNTDLTGLVSLMTDENRPRVGRGRPSKYIA